MSGANYYDVTTWPVGDASTDVGEVIISIIADVKTRQAQTDHRVEGGKPGAVIYLPPGDYPLRTPVVIDVSFLRIEGSGHGFTSSSIRFNVPADEWAELHELWPGGSRILVQTPAEDDRTGPAPAAFTVEREGSPRISSVEFVDFCIDGLHFHADGSDRHPENTYVNGKTGILVAGPNDSFRITGMGLIYLEHALVIRNADALSVHDNFIAECGNCIELQGWGQASKITDNLIGAGPAGHSIYAENHGGLLVTANNVFPRGASSVHLRGVTRSSVTNNRLHSFYPGMLILEDGCSENLVATNHLLRDREPWTPFQDVHNGRDDLFGLLSVSGSDNSIVGNHFSSVMDPQDIRPHGATPVVISLISGGGNYLHSNHAVGTAMTARSADSAFEAQVDALLTTGSSQALALAAVIVEPGSIRNTILDSGTEDQIVADRAVNAVRATPSIPSPSGDAHRRGG